MDWQNLKETLPHREKWLDSLAHKEKVAEIKLDLLNHAGMKMLKEEWQSRIDGLNLSLLYKEDMKQEERIKTIAERNAYRDMLGFFLDAEDNLNQVEVAINNLKSYEQGTTTGSPYGA